MNKEYVKEVSKKAKKAIYDLIRMRRPYDYLVNNRSGVETLDLNESIDDFKDRTVKECREVSDLIWDLWEENQSNQDAVNYLTPLLYTYNLIVELGEHPTDVSNEQIEEYMKTIYPEL